MIYSKADYNPSLSISSFMNAPNLAGEGVTLTPALSRARTLSSAFPFPPEIIAPA
jgi:hypothetical protein